MTSSDLARPLWQTYEAVRLGWRQFWTEYPIPVLLTALVPRGVMQIVFFTELGGVLAGAQQRQHAYIGALVLTLTGTNVANVVDVPFADKQNAIFWRIRGGRTSPVLTLLGRSSLYPLMGMLLLVAQAAIAAPIVGMTGVGVRLIPWLWIYAVIACSFAAAGLGAGALTIARRADVLAPNVLSYLVILCSGAVVPPGRLPWVDTAGAFLPGRHGLAALNAALGGRPWAAQAALESAVVLAWVMFAVAAIRFQAHRARKHGQDDFD